MRFAEGSPFPPIAEYAFLSDRQVQALVAPSGNVEWLCLPRPDSPSVFGAMLDRAAGHFRLGPGRGHRPRRPALRPRDARPGDDVADADRVARDPGRAPRRSLVRRHAAGGRVRTAARRPRGRTRPAANRPMRERPRRAPDGLRALARLRAGRRDLGVRDRGLQPRARADRAGRPAAPADERPADGVRGQARAREHDDARRRRAVRRAVVVRPRTAAVLPGRRRPDVADAGVLARMAEPRRVPRPPVADPPAAQRAHAQGPHVRAHRRPDGGGDHLAARDAGRRAELGLPVLVDPRLDVRAVGPVHARVRLGGGRVLRVRAPIGARTGATSR